MRKILTLLCMTLFACGEDPSVANTSDGLQCEKMIPDAKWGVYPSGIISGNCGYLPSYWIYTDSSGKLDMSGDDCVMVNHYIHEEECREYSNYSCEHPDRNLKASFHYSLVRTEGLEKSVQYNGTILVSIVDYDMQMMCEAMYEARIIHHPNASVN